MLINKKDNAKYATYQQNPSDPLFFIRNETHFVSFIYLLLLKIIGLIRLCRQKKDAKKVHVYLLYIFFFKRKNKVWVIVYVIKRKSCTFTRHSEHNEFTRIYIYVYIYMYMYTYLYIYLYSHFDSQNEKSFTSLKSLFNNVVGGSYILVV